MKDGDRIVAIDAKPIATWHAVRAEIGASAGPRRIDVERARERLGLTVTRFEPLAVDERYELIATD